MKGKEAERRQRTDRRFWRWWNGVMGYFEKKNKWDQWGMADIPNRICIINHVNISQIKSVLSSRAPWVGKTVNWISRSYSQLTSRDLIRSWKQSIGRQCRHLVKTSDASWSSVQIQDQSGYTVLAFTGKPYQLSSKVRLCSRDGPIY